MKSEKIDRRNEVMQWFKNNHEILPALIARELNVSTSSVYNWKRGTMNIADENWNALKKLGKPVIEHDVSQPVKVIVTPIKQNENHDSDIAGSVNLQLENIGLHLASLQEELGVLKYTLAKLALQHSKPKP